MTTPVFLEVNGEILDFSGRPVPATVAHLLEELGIDAKLVVAEVNGLIVGRDAFSDHGLAAGDRVELVRFVGGG